jgi:hypothetical protein
LAVDSMSREQTRRDAEKARNYAAEGQPIVKLCNHIDALLAELEQAERERDERPSAEAHLRIIMERDDAREDVARCAADTTAADLAQEIEFMKAEAQQAQEQHGRELEEARRAGAAAGMLHDAAERDLIKAEARLAKVPALVEAASDWVRVFDAPEKTAAEWSNAIQRLRHALAVWEQE